MWTCDRSFCWVSVLTDGRTDLSCEIKSDNGHEYSLTSPPHLSLIENINNSYPSPNNLYLSSSNTMFTFISSTCSHSSIVRPFRGVVIIKLWFANPFGFMCELRVPILWFPWSWQLSLDALMDVGFPCDEAVLFRDTIKGTLFLMTLSVILNM